MKFNLKSIALLILGILIIFGLILFIRKKMSDKNKDSKLVKTDSTQIIKNKDTNEFGRKGYENMKNIESNKLGRKGYEDIKNKDTNELGIKGYEDMKNKYSSEFGRKGYEDMKNKSIILKEILAGNQSYNFGDFKKEITLQNEFYKLGLAPKIYDYFECDNKFYLVMEPYDETLFEYFFDNNTADLSLLQMLDLFKNVIDQVEEKVKIANDNRLKHGDLHINNIMVKVDKNTKKITDIILIDFGRSRKLDDNERKQKDYIVFYKYLAYNFRLLFYYLFTGAKTKTIINTLTNKDVTILFLQKLIKYVYLDNDKLSEDDKEKIRYIIQDLEDDKTHVLRIPTYTALRQLENTNLKYFDNIDQYISVVKRLLTFFGLEDLDYNGIKEIMKMENTDDFDIGNELKKKYKFETFRFLEYFGFIKDCGERLKRFTSDIDIINDCDWTKISEKPLGSGIYGSTYKVNCEKLE